MDVMPQSIVNQGFYAVYVTTSAPNGKRYAVGPRETSNFEAAIVIEGQKYILSTSFIVSTPNQLKRFQEYCVSHNISIQGQ